MYFVKLRMWLLTYSTRNLPQVIYTQCFLCSIPLCLAVVIIQVDPPLTRTILEGGSTDVCVSKNIESVRAVNFSLTPIDGSAGGMLKCRMWDCLSVMCVYVPTF